MLSGAPPNVAVSTNLSHSQLRGIYADADVFVLPSFEDAYGLVTLEALASGVPVVVSDGAGASELISHGRHGLVVPAGSATALADAVRQLADPDLRAELGRAGRELVEQAHSWDQYGTRVLAALGELAEAS